MKILITGATGFLGGQVATACLEAGHSVSAFVRSSSRTEALEAQHIECVRVDLEQADTMAPHLKQMQAIVHCAGGGKVIHTRDFYRGNVDTTQALLQAVKKAGALLEHFVLVSSLAAHGPASKGLPSHENMPPGPITHYGRSKLMAERIAQKYTKHFPVSILRPPALYGPGDTRFLMMYQQILSGVFPLPPGQNQMSMLYGADCVSAIMACLHHPHSHGGVYFIEDGHIYNTSQLVQTIAQSLKTQVKCLPVPIGVLKGIALVSESLSQLKQTPAFLTRDKIKDMQQSHWLCSSEKIRSELDWLPEIGLEEGIDHTTAFYQNQGWL